MSTKKKKKKKAQSDTNYAHNPNYCMIMPDSEKRNDRDIVSTGQS